MSYPPDYHMHTALCRHAVGEAVDYAAHASRAGLTEIGFSDHSPMRRDDFDSWRMRLDQLEGYVAQVRAAQTRHPELAIRLALEIDYIPGQEAWVRELAGRYPWDYLIGSVHYISETWDVDNPAKKEQWHLHDPLEVWTLYFDRLTEAAASGLFDIIGHADLPKKFGIYPQGDYTNLYCGFLEAAKKHNQVIEVNTAGLRKECQEIYPSGRFLSLAYLNGIPITFGSDAHAPEEVGMDFDKGVMLARSIGYTHSCRYQGRQRKLVPI